MRYYPAGKKVLRLYLGGALSHSGHSRLDGGHSTTPGRASDIHSLPGCKEDTHARRGAVVAYDTSDGRYSGGSNVRR